LIVLISINTLLFFVEKLEYIEQIDGEVYPAEYYQSEKGNYLCVNGFFFLRNTVSSNSMSWRCTLYRGSYKCRARARTDFSRSHEAILGIGELQCKQ